MKASLTKITHRGTIRIRVDIPYQKEAIIKIKTIKGRKWSQTQQCWHVPYTKAAFLALKEHFEIELERDPEVGQGPIDKTEREKVNYTEIVNNQKQADDFVEVVPEHDFRVKVLIPWQRKDWIEQIKSLPDRAWNTTQKYWSVPKTAETLARLEQLFGKQLKVANSIQWKAANDNSGKTRPKTFQTIQKSGRKLKTVIGHKVIIEKENEYWLRVFVPYDKKGWIEVLKNTYLDENGNQRKNIGEYLM